MEEQRGDRISITSRVLCLTYYQVRNKYGEAFLKVKWLVSFPMFQIIWRYSTDVYFYSTDMLILV
jgi:hypothetical protein